MPGPPAPPPFLVPSPLHPRPHTHPIHIHTYPPASPPRYGARVVETQLLRQRERHELLRTCGSGSGRPRFCPGLDPDIPNSRSLLPSPPSEEARACGEDGLLLLD